MPIKQYFQPERNRGVVAPTSQGDLDGAQPQEDLVSKDGGDGDLDGYCIAKMDVFQNCVHDASISDTTQVYPSGFYPRSSGKHYF